jgi:hypothetical protein
LREIVEKIRHDQISIGSADSSANSPNLASVILSEGANHDACEWRGDVAFQEFDSVSPESRKMTQTFIEHFVNVREKLVDLIAELFHSLDPTLFGRGRKIDIIDLAAVISIMDKWHLGRLRTLEVLFKVEPEKRRTRD